ncbi:dioxygenase [Francisella sp. Scap27]|uniref:dioxygenase family protein n=1 Tax=Francisella sp. Scap27 TaxID=2589986 RepID=UPI001C4DB58E|nr:dioxygenase [Francisella sp. Scap27]
MSDLTKRVLDAYSKFDDPRSKELTQSLIKHIHSFVKDVRLTNQEWEFCWKTFRTMADFTGDDRNEFLLMGDILGVSQLVEEVNHQVDGVENKFALVGPFLRANAPFRDNGAVIMSDNTAGERVEIKLNIKSTNNQPIAGAVIDVWQAATNGKYECEDANQPDMNLRGKFVTDNDGKASLVALVPTAYPVPNDGPAGDLLRSAKRNILRPAHIHFIVVAEGFETLVTQVFIDGDKQTEDDPVFTANHSMSEHFVKQADDYSLECNFVLSKGESTYPEAPIK